jgi:hypothetical protein
MWVWDGGRIRVGTYLALAELQQPLIRYTHDSSAEAVIVLYPDNTVDVVKGTIDPFIEDLNKRRPGWSEI